MLNFRAQPLGDIPVSIQLLNQLSFAIASSQYPPGSRLPSTRQLAMQTGLHRNTISKVYRQLEDMGLVETRAGSGIYVRDSSSINSAIQETVLAKQTEACQLVGQSLDRLLEVGCSLVQAQALFNAEIEWRLRCRAQVWITVPRTDYGTGRLMVEELQKALLIPLELVPIEELESTLTQTQAQSATVLTIRHFLRQVEAVAAPWSLRILPVEIYDYSHEVNLLKTLPTHTCVGLVSLSLRIIEVATVIIHSMKGDELLVISAEATALDDVRRLVRRADVIICDSVSHDTLKAVVREARADLIRIPQIVCAESYISPQSIEVLRRELGIQECQELAV